MTDAIKRTTIDKDKILKQASEYEDLYSDLVWAAGKPPLAADAGVWEEHWNEDGRSTPIEIRAKAVEALRKIVEKYPEEYADLKGSNAGYVHGFNSGSLAAFRWMLHSFDDMLYAETANDWYPNLDT